ncbi:hypothetical protein CAPI_01160 [Corynebacterium capitovis DSM 44611]|uniref:hypothetical protein n=1 Tax=Corynebacterium capitovis TaxID=131081 RepID=UPI000373F583|nr:hypothetical protein [Corynebacterium capitovis]WKD56810.1 hypothetical protein CAPI_01160 [Corynebacterium capitovis DSM 44611]
MNPNDDETRQFRREPQASNQPPRPERPRQYFPDPAQQQVSEASYYQEPVYAQPRQRSTTAAVALGVVAALAALTAIVFMFLWRGAASEAQRVPETVTVTQTQTTTQTTTQNTTTTRRTGLLGGDSTASQLPTVLPSELPTQIPPEVRDNAGSLLDDLVNGANSLLQGQQ